MISRLNIILISTLTVVLALAQTPSPIPDPNPEGANVQGGVPPEQPVAPPSQGVEELDASGLVMNKNTFNYDGNEGRDPFKVYREFVQPIAMSTSGSQGSAPQSSEKNIRSVIVPDDIIVQGILYKKKDPVALVVIKGVKGLNKLRVNSLVGRNEGKVIEIRQDKMVIEQVKEFDGQKFTEKIVLEVRAKKN